MGQDRSIDDKPSLDHHDPFGTDPATDGREVACILNITRAECREGFAENVYSTLERQTY